ncbi:MAG TPA: sulfite oxidase [Actinomycetota bacterium]
MDDEAEGISAEELQLATRNHGMPLEALAYPITPIGLHYLLIHYDIPVVDGAAWRLGVEGDVERPLHLSLEEIRARPAITMEATFECAGNGRALMRPRAISQPWLREAVGTGAWTGTPIRPLLDEAGVRPGAVEVVFTGMDRGVEAELDQRYRRSLPLDEAMGDDVLLAYELNGRALPPQHGYPLRLVVPGWYGMTNVKWLQSIEVVSQPYRGYQNERAYRFRMTDDEPGVPLTRMVPRSLMVPPGVPEFMSRRRFVDAGRTLIEGRAWSGWGAIERVEVSDDGGATWSAAALEPQRSAHAWQGWSFDWTPPGPGEFELCCRARDGAGNEQPLEPEWNVGGYANNAVQRVGVTVREP